jgi:hypothetical protein
LARGLRGCQRAATFSRADFALSQREGWQQCATLDAVIENEPHGLGFVDYLRLAFEWGGFPGYADMPDKAPALIYRLKDRLLPI